MKYPVFVLFFLIPLCGSSQDISGNWSWQAETGETLMEISLKAEGSDYTGHHCTVFQNGDRIDCIDVTEPASIRIKRTAENVFEGTIRSGYSASEGKIKLLFNPEEKTLVFEIMEGPVDIYYLPKKAVLKSSLDQEKDTLYFEFEEAYFQEGRYDENLLYIKDALEDEGSSETFLFKIMERRSDIASPEKIENFQQYIRSSDFFHEERKWNKLRDYQLASHLQNFTIYLVDYNCEPPIYFRVYPLTEIE